MKETKCRRILRLLFLSVFHRGTFPYNNLRLVFQLCKVYHIRGLHRLVLLYEVRCPDGFCLVFKVHCYSGAFRQVLRHAKSTTPNEFRPIGTLSPVNHSTAVYIRAKTNFNLSPIYHPHKSSNHTFSENKQTSKQNPKSVTTQTYI